VKLGCMHVDVVWSAKQLNAPALSYDLDHVRGNLYSAG
jgi:hypothetical protein